MQYRVFISESKPGAWTKFRDYVEKHDLTRPTSETDNSGVWYVDPEFAEEVHDSLQYHLRRKDLRIFLAMPGMAA